MRILITTVVLILLSCATVSAQADFLEKGTGGLELALGYSHHDLTGVAFAGFSSTGDGSHEFGLLVGRATTLSSDFTILKPSVTSYLIKQKPGRPLTLGFGFGGELVIANIGSDNSAEESRYTAGGILLSNTMLSKSVWFQPALSVSYWSGTEHQNGETVAGISLSLIFKLPSHSFIRLNPSISFSDNERSYSIILGLILPKASQ